MRLLTRQIKVMYRQDIKQYDRVNNSKDSKWTEAQRLQSKTDRLNHYLNKWESLREKCETPAQKRMCNDMIELISAKLN